MGQVRQYPSETAFTPLVDDKDYKISLPSYIFYGGDGYDMLRYGIRQIRRKRLTHRLRTNCVGGPAPAASVWQARPSRVVPFERPDKRAALEDSHDGRRVFEAAARRADRGHAAGQLPVTAENAPCPEGGH